MNVSLWHLTDMSPTLLPRRCLSNFRAIEKVYIRISRLRDFTRSSGKTSVRLVNRGPVITVRQPVRRNLSQTVTTQQKTTVTSGPHGRATWASWVHDDVIKWKHFRQYWPFVQGIYRSSVDSHNCQWRVAFMFSLIYAWTNSWVINQDAGDWRRHRAHCDVTVMS